MQGTQSSKVERSISMARRSQRASVLFLAYEQCAVPHLMLGRRIMQLHHAQQLLRRGWVPKSVPEHDAQ